MPTTDISARVARVERLFAAADRGDSVPLAVLTDEEECVLSQGRWALAGSAAWLAWTGRTEADRAAATGRVLASLRDRGLAALEETGEGYRLTPSPEVATLVTARSEPAFVLTVLPVPGEPPLLVAPFGYAVLDEVAGFRGLVVELRGADRHDYRLMSARRAAEGLAAWAHRAVTTEDWGVRCGTVVVEVLRHRAGEQLDAAATSVAGPDSGKEGMTLFFGGARERHPDQAPAALAGQLEALLLQAADGIRP